LLFADIFPFYQTWKRAELFGSVLEAQRAKGENNDADIGRYNAK
jgi:hypothetical protein